MSRFQKALLLIVDFQSDIHNQFTFVSAIPVRLLGGRGPFEGTVELYHLGKWGEVCDTNFDVKDAEVICRMLGYTAGIPRLLNSTDSGTGLVWMDNLLCNGGEIDVALCKSDGFGSKTCSRNRKAAIYCGQDIQVRIHGGKGSYEGNIDIFQGNKWYPVCQEGFSMSAAKVVCRTLGFPDSNDPDLVNSSNSYFVDSFTDSGQLLSCSGSEGDIGLCHLKETTSRCSQQIIRCPRIAVRLVNGKQPNEGLVEIYHNGQWGTICGGGFQKYDAHVICRMLGLHTEEQVFLNEEFGTSNGPVILQNISCTGNENDISGCLLNWKVNNCSNQSAVGVRCVPTPIRLAGGGGPWEGRIEVFHNSQWGTVCDTGFGNEAARVVCRMLGFLDGTTDAFAHSTSFYGQSRMPILLDQISCTGTELDINGCRTKEWGYHSCDNNHEAGALCRATNVRLSGGSHTMEGRVEIKIDGTWSTLCDEEWNDNEANIICKMLTAYPLNRFVHGKAFTNSYFGEGSGTAMLSNLKCNGTEVDLLHCSMKRGGRPHCDHSHDAGVSCSLLCNSLGYWMNTAILYRNAWFGQGHGVSFDLQTECSGKESQIFFCPLKNTFGNQNCQHTEDVGVQCAATPLGLNKIRLALGQSKGNGRLEIKYNGKWGTVCSEQWTSQNSKAVCRMLGYQNRTIETHSIQRNDTAVVLGSLDCLEIENDIGFCKGDLDKSQCSDDIVNIDCSGGIEVRLSGGSSPADGRVDIKENGQWGSLCDKNFGLAELQVICNTLGYRDTLPYLYHLPSLEMHRSAFGVDQLTCSGLEDHIAQCQMLTTASCHHRYAHLKCFDSVQQFYSATGTVMSDNYPGHYNPNTDYLYIIQPPPGLYKLSVDVFKMADIGDFLQIKESPFGKELGKYSVSSYIPVALSSQFWIRFKTDDQRSARGFKLHWSPFDFKDLLSLNCEVNRWGAAINITLLKMANLQVNYTDVYMMDPDCYGQIVGDKLLFNKPYSECGSTKNISHFYITYQNNITFISEGVTHEIPLECQLFKDDRILHYHQIDGNLELDDVNAYGSGKSLFHVDLYYDSELTQTDDKQFSGKFVYRIAVNEDHHDHYLSLTQCFLTMKKHGLDRTLLIVKNSSPLLENVLVRYLANDIIVLEVQVSDNISSNLECEAAWKL
ncbi:Neurotrypsin [Mytilus coruscus]|uniref:Neurotrypsin n=1 Tax=Mytilus coruscus TaxID=42192 RepID=A0A6J8EPP0_MYTCO|nr:Neurotrypsin [Mytilus coruscus]